MFNTVKFSTKLKALRGKMPRRIFAENIGISHQAVRSYEEGWSIPNAYVLYNIAKAFNVSVDELLGLNDDEVQNENC